MRNHTSVILSFLTLAFLALFLAGPPAVADDAKDQIKAFETKMKEADEEGKVRLIEGLAKSGNPGAAKALSKFMMNRSTMVGVAAIKAMGELKDSKYLGRLMGMVKSSDKKPKVLAAVVGAIGAYGSKKALKTLVDVAKKWITKDKDVTSAAATGLGQIPDKAAVDELIKLLDLSYPKQSATGPAVSTTTRDLMAKSRPAIIGSLQTLTGWDFEDADAWKKFWDKRQRSWKPGAKDIDLKTLDQWEDPGYCFILKRPGKTWKFDRGEDYKAYRIFMKAVDDKDVTQAYVYVMAFKNTTGMTPEQKGSQFEDSYHKTWKDIKEESTEREDYRIGKDKGFMHAFTGLDSYSTVAKLRTVFINHGPMMFIIGTWQRSGLPEELVAEVAAALKSFRFTD